MERVTIERLALDAQQVRLDAHNTYLASYPHFVRYFAELKEITVHEFIIGAMFTYGWMPTRLNFKSQDFDMVVSILNEVKQGNRISGLELARLQAMVNNSIVGASKLLHFICPDVYPMWDSNVCRYLDAKGEIAEPASYRSYLDNCKEIVQSASFGPVHAAINAQCGYEVTACRAFELIIFETGRQMKSGSR